MVTLLFYHTIATFPERKRKHHQFQEKLRTIGKYILAFSAKNKLSISNRSVYSLPSMYSPFFLLGLALCFGPV